MHDGAREYVTNIVRRFDLPLPHVLDLGGRDVNGTIHSLFPTKPYVVDLHPGEGVDVVANAATWRTDHRFDIVLCLEVFEHTPEWRDIILTAYHHLIPGGIFIVTCARDDRPPHSMHTGGPLEWNEYYRNLTFDEIRVALEPWAEAEITLADGAFINDDLYAWAVK